MHVDLRPVQKLALEPPETEATPSSPAPARPAVRARLQPAPVLSEHSPDPPQSDRAIALPVVARIARLADAGLLLAATVATAGKIPDGMLAGQCVVAAIGFAVSALWLLRSFGVYRTERLTRMFRQLGGALIGVGFGGLGLAATGWLVTGRRVADLGPWSTAACLTAALLLIGRRFVLAMLLALWRAQGRLVRNVAVIGANDYSRSFIATTQEDPHSALHIVGLYDDRLTRIPRDTALPIQGSVGTLLLDARDQRIDVIVVALPLSATDRIAQIRDQLSATVSDIFLTADTAGLRYDGRDFEALGRNGVIRVGSRPLSDWDAALKQAFDLVGASVLLLLLSPLLLAVAALIRLDSPGAALFRQPRTGFNNRPFTVFKFRTMYQHLSDLHADRQTTRDDHRVTKLGRFLRRSSIDELPQLLNVLRGEMSLVGPRPHAANTKAANRYFDEVVAEYALRHRIKPGITGWAQVNGWRGETLEIEHIQQRVAHDLAYVENWSLLLDVRILVMTLLRGSGGKNAY